ncbi:MAG: hypothetical protein HY588_01885 [Candidatus Omnitrophica bacterium]|nr:hypothetical protein [Candidatus Omnitrophota bacterium]
MNTTQLKPCDILLYKGTGRTSRLIRWKTKSPYSHVAVVVEPAIYLGIESNTGHQSGVRAFDLRKLDQAAVDLFRIKPASQFQPEKVISFLVAHLGMPYDYRGVLWLGILKLLNLKSKSNRFQKDQDYFCSELVYEAFNNAGLDIVPEVDEADITSPGDIAKSSVLEKIELPKA